MYCPGVVTFDGGFMDSLSFRAKWGTVIVYLNTSGPLRPAKSNGTNRARTCDLMRVKHALFQLSYDPAAIPSF